jgi:hypothetical protein
MTTVSLNVVSGSRAEDAGYRALADAATAAAQLDTWRVVGGHMVNLHALRSSASLELRATRDADLAVELLAIRESGLLRRLHELGYRNENSGNRFERESVDGRAAIDLLAPSFDVRHVPNLDAGPLAVDGVPALHIALARKPVLVDLHAALTSGLSLDTRLALPDTASALAVKAFAYTCGLAPRDAEDVRRLLEVAYAEATPWPSSVTFAQAAELLHRHFDTPGSGLVSAARDSAGRTRIRALVRAVTG